MTLHFGGSLFVYTGYLASSAHEQDLRDELSAFGCLSYDENASGQQVYHFPPEQDTLFLSNHPSSPNQHIRHLPYLVIPGQPLPEKLLEPVARALKPLFEKKARALDEIARELPKQLQELEGVLLKNRRTGLSHVYELAETLHHKLGEGFAMLSGASVKTALQGVPGTDGIIQRLSDLEKNQGVWQGKNALRPAS